MILDKKSVGPQRLKPSSVLDLSSSQELFREHLKSISKEGKETDADYEIRPLPTTLVMVVTINRAR